jgi:hypothetical protein
MLRVVFGAASFCVYVKTPVKLRKAGTRIVPPPLAREIVRLLEIGLSSPMLLVT